MNRIRPMSPIDCRYRLFPIVFVGFLYLIAGFFLAGRVAMANPFDSAYTKLHLDKDCFFHESDDMGAAAKCKGYKDIPVWFFEGDLRQMVRFGGDGGPGDRWQSFSEFNRINDTIEWRLANGKPFATILRWFIENPDPDSGVPDEANQGQVLVISTIANEIRENSCVVGYVDARANKNANVIARNVADQLAEEFDCNRDKPVFHGDRGRYSGSPG